MQRHGSDPWVREIPWRRKWQPIPVILAWEIPWTEEPGGLQSMGLQTVRHSWATNTFHFRRPQGRREKKGEKKPLLYENFTQPNEQTLCSSTLVFSHFSPNQFSYQPRLVTTAGDLRKIYPLIPRIRLGNKILTCRQNKVLPLLLCKP